MGGGRALPTTTPKDAAGSGDVVGPMSRREEVERVQSSSSSGAPGGRRQWRRQQQYGPPRPDIVRYSQVTTSGNDNNNYSDGNNGNENYAVRPINVSYANDGSLANYTVTRGPSSSNARPDSFRRSSTDVEHSSHLSTKRGSDHRHRDATLDDRGRDDLH